MSPLLFQPTAREPELQHIMQQFHTQMTTLAHRHLAEAIPDPAWATWAAQLIPTVAVTAVIAWLDAGQPDPDRAANRRAVDSIIAAAQ